MLNKKNLHQYQLNILEQAKTTPNLGLFMEPGLGKTATALTIIQESPKGKTLVIAPKRVAESVWVQECERWQHLKHFTVVKIMGTPSARLKSLQSESDVYVINLENVAWLVENWPKDGFDYLIVDESSRFKDPSTKRFKAIKKVLKTFKRRIILTGTPTPQGMGDLYSQVGILDLGERLEKSLTKFREKYMYASEKNRHTNVVYKWALNSGADIIINDRISDICFSLRAQDYLQLPALTNLYHSIALDKDIKAKYNELKKNMVAEVGAEEITAPTAATLTNKLLQFTSGAIYNESHEVVHIHDTKLEFLESLLEESSAPTLLFYHFKHSLQRILERFPEAVVLQDDNMEMWRDGKIKLLLAHPQSGGIGLNLQCNAGELAQCVWYDLPYSSENYIQANARVYRQGQTKPVIIHHLTVENSIDGQVVKVLEGKINLQDALINALKFALVV
jgi:superfamily II DNA or RNA helicase